MEPYKWLPRIRLPPWVLSGEAYASPWLKDERFGYPLVSQLRNPLPDRAIFLTAPPERSLPEFGDQEAERSQRLTVGRHGMIVEVALDELSQPISLGTGIGWCLRRRSSCLITCNFARKRSGRDFRLIWNLPRRDLPLMKMKPRKLKVCGLPSPRRLRFSAALRPNSIKRVVSGWSDSECFPNLTAHASRPRSAARSKPTMMPSGITHDDHVTRGLAPSPAFSPEIEDVVQVDVGEQR
jgi:hypothetical protein